MSAIDRVREKFKTPMSEGNKSSKSSFAGSAASSDRDSEKLSSLEAATCATCTHYTAEPGKTPDGWCRKHRTEAWGAYGGGCAADWTPADPATRTLERRRSAVVARLEADPALRYSFDVQGATPTAPADGPVSVLLGLRDSSGVIVTGELCIPAARWPGLAAFAEHWRKAAEGAPS